MADRTADDRSDVDGTIRTYAAAFGRADAAAAARYCQTPFMWVTADRVTLMALPEEVERTYASVLEALQRRGFSHTEFKELRVGLLGPSLALASGWAVRYAGDTELERIGATYLLRRTEGEWRIVVLTAHPPEAVVQGVGQVFPASA